MNAPTTSQPPRPDIAVPPSAARADREERRSAGRIARPILAWFMAGWTVLYVLAGAVLLTMSSVERPLVVDDFSSTESGWPTDVETGWSSGYVDGEYMLAVATGASAPFRLQGLIWDEGPRMNVSVAVDLRRVSDGGSLAGVGCWNVEDDEGYLFLAGPGGGYAIAYATASTMEPLVEGALAEAPTDGTFRVVGECFGGIGVDRLGLSIGEDAVTTARDPRAIGPFDAVVVVVVGPEPSEFRFDRVQVDELEPSDASG